MDWSCYTSVKMVISHLSLFPIEIILVTEKLLNETSFPNRMGYSGPILF